MSSYTFWPSDGEKLCSFDEVTDSCDWEHYALKLGLIYAAPPLIVAMLGLLVGIPILIIYCVGRCCCNKYKACRSLNLMNFMNPERCIRGKWGKAKRFFFENGMIFRIVFCIIMACTLLAIIGAIALDVDVNLAHINWMDTSKDFVDQKVADIDNTVQRLESLYFNSYVASDTQSIYTQILDQINEFQSIVETAYSYASNILISKFVSEIMMMFGWMVAVISAIAGIVWTKRNFSLAMQTCSFILIVVFLSCLLAFTLTSQRLYADVCVDNDVSISGGKSAIMAGILPCGDELLLNATNQLDKAIQEVVNYTCKAIYAECFNTSGWVTCQPGYICNQTTLANATDHMMIQDFLFCGDSACPPSSAPQCAAAAASNYTMCYHNVLTETACINNCLNEQSRNASNMTSLLTSEAAILIEGLEDEIRPLLDCGFVKDYAETIQYDLCTRMLRVQWVALCLLLAELGFITAMFLAMLTQNAVLEHRPHVVANEDKNPSSSQSRDFELFTLPVTKTMSVDPKTGNLREPRIFDPPRLKQVYSNLDGDGEEDGEDNDSSSPKESIPTYD